MAMVKGRRWLLAAAVFLLVLAACTSTAGRPGPGTGTAGTPAGSGSAAPGGLRAVRHVWVIELENQGYAQSFGTPSADPYLARTLPRMGALLENYYAIGHSSAANYVAQVSGQAPDLATQIDCPLWVPFAGHVVAGPYHQVLGEGCVYPAAVQTLGNQLSAAGRSWAAYLQDMGNDPARDNTVATARGPACGHPATWAIDSHPESRTGRSVRRPPRRVHVLPLGHRQPGLLRRAHPVVPAAAGRPDPGQHHPGVLLDLAEPVQRRPRRTLRHRRPGRAGAGRRVPGAVGAEDHGRAGLPDGGLIVITFDEGSDSAACCGEASGFGPDHPNVPLPGKNGPGGGRIGAVVLSPLIRPGTVSTVDYNHYSLLRTVEDIFGLPHLGDAAMPQVRSFGPDVFG